MWGVELARYEVKGTGNFGIILALTLGVIGFGTCLYQGFVNATFIALWIGVAVFTLLIFGLVAFWANKWRAGRSFVLTEDRVIVTMADSRREILYQQIVSVEADFRASGEGGDVTVYRMKVGSKYVDIGTDWGAANFAAKVAENLGQRVIGGHKSW